MTDERMAQFLQTVVDSPTKLQILILFAERTISKGSAREIVQRTARDIWSVTEALEELVQAGVLRRQAPDRETLYIYDPAPEHRDLIVLLATIYNDPLARDELHRFVRDLALPSPYYRSYANSLWGAIPS